MKYTGRKACGMRPTGALLPETEKWLYDGGGFLYSSAGTSGEGIGYYYVNGEKQKESTYPAVMSRWMIMCRRCCIPIRRFWRECRVSLPTMLCIQTGFVKLRE